MQDGGVHLRHDPTAAVVVTEVWQLFVSVCGAVDTAFVAYLTAFGAVDTAFGAWHGGHSLWTPGVEQRTQPCGAVRKWTPPLGSGPRPTEEDIRVLWGFRSGTLPCGTCQVPIISAYLLTLIHFCCRQPTSEDQVTQDPSSLQDSRQPNLSCNLPSLASQMTPKTWHLLPWVDEWDALWPHVHVVHPGQRL